MTMAQTARIRIAFLCSSFPRFSGDEASIFLARLVEALGEQGVEGMVICPADTSEPRQEPSCYTFAVERYRYGIFSTGRLAYGAGIIPNIKRRPLLALQIPGLLLCMVARAWRERKRFDLCVANWSLAGLAAWLLRGFLHRPYLIVLRGEDVRLLRSPLLRALLLPSLRGASRIVSVNESFCEEIRERLPELRDRVLLIGNGVELPSCSPQEQREMKVKLEAKIQGKLERPTLVFLGSVIPRKKIEGLFPLLSLPVFSGASLLVVGRLAEPSYEAFLRRTLEEKRLDSRVHFLGALAPEEVAALLSLSDWYVSASEFEGRPNAMLEALLMGVPVLASHIPAHAEIIREGENGFLFPEDFPQLNEKISSLDKASLEKMRQAAKASVASFRWEDSAQAYVREFQRVLKGSKE